MPSIRLNPSLRSIPVKFEFDRSLTDSVQRLTARVDPYSERHAASPDRRLYGEVRAERVVLGVAAPFTGNAFGRHFYGTFTEAGGKTILSGKFAVRPWVRAYIAVFIAFSVLVGAVFLLSLFVGTLKLGQRVIPFATYLAFLTAYVTFMSFANAWSEGDMEFMKQEIALALD